LVVCAIEQDLPQSVYTKQIRRTPKKKDFIKSPFVSLL
jgi:hypothetical protein